VIKRIEKKRVMEAKFFARERNALCIFTGAESSIRHKNGNLDVSNGSNQRMKQVSYFSAFALTSELTVKYPKKALFIGFVTGTGYSFQKVQEGSSR
jgi:hypothetical protein